MISKRRSAATLDVLSVKIDPRDPNILYLGSRGEGLLKSIDGGESWYRLADKNRNLSQRANVYDIAVDPQNNGNIYIGTYQDRFGRLFRSSNAGKSWEEVYRVSREKYAIFAVEIDSYNPSVIYVGTAEGGLLKSADYGKSWQIIKWFDDVISDIKVTPLDTRIVYVSTLQQGIYRTTDKGASWQKLAGLQNFLEASQIESLTIDPSRPAVLYAGYRSGLLQTSDSGQSWQRVNIVIPPVSVPVQAMALDPAGTLYYGAGNLVYRSQDNGQTWTIHPIASVKRVQVIAVAPQSPNVVYVGMHK